jgi:hypothetical protein
MSDGKPPAFTGPLFVAVWPGRWQGNYVEGLAEEFGCNATVSLRASDVPADAIGEEVWAKDTEGMEAVLRKILVAVFSDRDTSLTDKSVLNRANVYIGSTANGIVEKLQLLDGGRPEEKGAEWFTARGAGRQATSAAGLAQTISFGGAKRYQRYSNMR